MKIGYLGPVGSHSQTAVDVFIEHFRASAGQGGSVLKVPMTTLNQILEAVEEGSLELGCVPVENALEGSVAEILDNMALRMENTRIKAEFIRPVRHALIRRFEFLEGIQYVHSHPQAIGQCRQAVYDLLGTDVKFLPATSTSEAVKSLLTLDESHAALGSAKAAEHYGLEILVENIGNYNQNATRFLIISGQDLPEEASFDAKYPRKTSLCLSPHQNKPGALLEVLTILASYQLNMSKIESRPTKKCLGEYLFHLDIEGEISQEAENRLKGQTSYYKCLGIYPQLGELSA